MNENDRIKLIVIDADKTAHTYKELTMSMDSIVIEKFIYYVSSLFNKKSNNLRIFNFHGLEILDTSDLNIFFTDSENNRLIYITTQNRTENICLFYCFKKLRKIGEGGFGRVYEAEQIFSKKHYALKFMQLRPSILIFI